MSYSPKESMPQKWNASMASQEGINYSLSFFSCICSSNHVHMLYLAFCATLLVTDQKHRSKSFEFRKNLGVRKQGRHGVDCGRDREAEKGKRTNLCRQRSSHMMLEMNTSRK